MLFDEALCCQLASGVAVDEKSKRGVLRISTQTLAESSRFVRLKSNLLFIHADSRQLSPVVELFVLEEYQISKNASNEYSIEFAHSDEFVRFRNEDEHSLKSWVFATQLASYIRLNVGYNHTPPALDTSSSRSASISSSSPVRENNHLPPVAAQSEHKDSIFQKQMRLSIGESPVVIDDLAFDSVISRHIPISLLDLWHTELIDLLNHLSSYAFRHAINVQSCKIPFIEQLHEYLRAMCFMLRLRTSHKKSTQRTCSDYAYIATNVHISETHANEEKLLELYSVGAFTTPSPAKEDAMQQHADEFSAVSVFYDKLMSVQKILQDGRFDEAVAEIKSISIPQCILDHSQIIDMIQSEREYICDSMQSSQLPFTTGRCNMVYLLRNHIGRYFDSIIAFFIDHYSFVLPAFRRRILFSQALSVVASAVSNATSRGISETYQYQLEELGMLTSFECLLTPVSNELKMCEDHVSAINMLCSSLSIQISPSFAANVPLPCVSRCSSTSQIRLTVFTREQLEFEFRLVPVIFSVAVNEQQSIVSMANVFGFKRANSQFERMINTESFLTLEAYCNAIVSLHSSTLIQHCDAPAISARLQSLRARLNAYQSKDLSILSDVFDLCRLCDGLTIVSCKSAKDRTAMSCTWKQAISICERFPGLEMQKVMDTLRRNGVRREIVHRNVGQKHFAFVYLQVLSLPKLFRPPAGSYDGNVST